MSVGFESMELLSKLCKCVFGDPSKVYDDSKHLRLENERIPDKHVIRRNVKLTNEEAQKASKVYKEYWGNSLGCKMYPFQSCRFDRVYGDIVIVVPDNTEDYITCPIVAISVSTGAAIDYS